MSRTSAGGLFVALDFDIGAVRTEPPVSLVPRPAMDQPGLPRRGASPPSAPASGRFSSKPGSTTSPRSASRLPAARDPAAAALLAGVVRSLAKEITTRDIATVEQLGLDTLEQRLADELRRAQPYSFRRQWGAWGDGRAKHSSVAAIARETRLI
jgi:hypothetical protein